MDAAVASTAVSSEDPAFRSVGIAGLGLIGGSIALAIRERWPAVRLVGVDRPHVLAHAAGVVDRAAATVAELGETDLVVLAAPVRQNAELLAQLGPHLARHTLVTDVGGTKRGIVQAAAGLNLATRFIGGHPIGGAERGGFGFARPDLFVGRPWIFTPDDSHDPDALGRLEGFAHGLGAAPVVTLDAGRHDHLMAFLSHLPQLTASALMDVVGDAAGPAGLRLAGRGLTDTTRLASSPAAVWRDICLTNPDEIAGALDALITRLTELRADVRRGQALEATFERAERARAELMKKGGA